MQGDRSLRFINLIGNHGPAIVQSDGYVIKIGQIEAGILKTNFPYNRTMSSTRTLKQPNTHLVRTD